MRLNKLLDVFSLPQPLGKSRPRGLTRVVTRLSLLLLILPLSFAVGVEVPYVEAAHAPGDPSVVGHWEAPFDTPVVGIHAVVLRTGKVLLWSGSDAWLWTPPAIGELGGGSFVQKPAPDNLFCSGHCSLADGRVLTIGGHKANSVGINDANFFDPFTETWIHVASMKGGRWYPTCTTLPDGRALALSGDISPTRRNDLPEVYDSGADRWKRLNQAKLSLPLYPWMFVLPSGKVFNAGPNEDTKTLDVNTQTWEAVGNTNHGHRGALSPAVMYGGKILIAGGDDPNDSNGWATNTAEIIDFNQPGPQWNYTTPMKYRRVQHNATVLPDGKVLVTGGTEKGFNDASLAVLAAEMFDPATETWTEMASMQRPRIYHSTGFLLPDGRVVVTGTDNETQFEIYSPPYLFKGTRPSITSVQSTVAYGSSIDVGYTTPAETSITTVALIRPSSVTHAFNQDQRYVPLTFTVSDGALSVQAPADANLAPPGYYMLFIVNDQGVPSVASFVNVGASVAPVTDIATTAVDAPSSVVKGDLVDVSGTVKNLGNQDVTTDINVTLVSDNATPSDSSDDITIGTRTIFGGLTAGASTTLTFSWDTSGVSMGNHILTASHDFVDDAATNNSKSTTMTVNAADGGITLRATGHKVRGLQKADLEWSGATSTNVDVYRDGIVIVTTENDGFYSDNIDKRGGGTYTYQVCEEGTSTCSNEATVTQYLKNLG